MERAWLQLTAEGMAAQPMMSLMVLDNILRWESPALPSAISTHNIVALMDELRGEVPELGSNRPAFLLRFGYGPPVSGRTGRLPLEAVMSKGATSA